MFTELNNKLIEAKENLRKKVKFEEQLQRLKALLLEEEENKNRVKLQLEKEKEDVARLEGLSLTNLLYTVSGRKPEKLDLEQQEVLAAKITYNEKLETINHIEKDIKNITEMLKLVGNADIQYEEIIGQKERLIYDTNTIWSDKLFALSVREADVSANLKEYNEAIAAGEIALESLNQALESLDSAKGWSTFDMFGGGMVTTAMKHSCFDDAKNHIQQAKNHLRNFQAELVDIQNHFQANLEIDGMLTFADYILDGFFVDWIVHDQLSDCFNQTQGTKETVLKGIEILSEQRDNLIKDIETIRQERLRLLESSN